MSEHKVYNVLFLCTHNSARSIMGEALIDHLGKGKFKGYSAGSMPATAPNPFALETLAHLNLRTTGYRSKNWDEFAQPGAPVMDFVVTVCDNAANEVCPIWPGQPMSAHWGVPDPAAAEGSEAVIAQAFADAYRMLQNRINVFVNLPLASVDRLSLQKRLNDIGAMRRDPSAEGAA